MATILLRKVTVIDSKSPHNGKKKDILIKNGLIDSISRAGSIKETKSTRVIEGGMVSPGWIDMRTVLTDPGFEWKESLRTLAEAGAAGGFTDLVCMPNTDPVIDKRDKVNALISRSENLPATIRPAGALTEQTKGENLAELYDMHTAGAVAFTDGTHPVQSSGIVLMALEYLQAFGGLAMLSPHDETISGSAQVHEGPVSTRLGMKGSPSLAEELALGRDLELHAYAGGKVHFEPLTTKGSVDKWSKTKSDQSISAGTSIPYILFNDEVLEKFDTSFKVFPPIRSESDRKALIKGLKNGKIQTLSSFHFPQSIEEKNLEFAAADFGMAMLEGGVPAAWKELVEKEGMKPEGFIDLISHNPRTVLGLEPVTITEEGQAVLTVFEKAEWEFAKQKRLSKARNYPFSEEVFPIRVKGIVNKAKWHPNH